MSVMNPDRRRQVLAALGVQSWAVRGLDAPDATSSGAECIETTALDPVKPASQTGGAALLESQPMQAPAGAPGPVPPHQPAVLEVPADWEALRAAVAACEACKLCATRTHTVFGVGPKPAPLMVIGEGPGAEEDLRGEPFVGRAGKLLDEMLGSIGYSRERDVFIANVVKCRPPGNRDPEAEEVDACRPFLDAQIRAVKPRLIVALGRVASQRLLDSTAPLSRMRGQSYTYGENATPVLVTYHPAYLLRSPAEKRKSWADLKTTARRLREGSA